MSSDAKLLKCAYPIADALNLKLRLYHKEGRLIEEPVTMELPVAAFGPQEEVIEFTPRVIASFISVVHAAVLVKIHKRVWILASYDATFDVVTVSVIDAEVLDLHEGTFKSGKLPPPGEWIKHFALGVKATFERKPNQSEWINVDAVVVSSDAMDEGQAAEPASDSRQPAAQSTDTE